MLIFIGVALFASHLVVPLARVIGWPGARIGGAAGTLARENSQRNPQRTGSTAAALMIGLALVTLVAMLAAGIRSSFFDAVNQLARATTPSLPRTTSTRSRSRPPTRSATRRA